MKVYFIGAGPGDPDLITVKGQRLIAECPVCLYAGSLVPEAIVEGAPEGAIVKDTAPPSRSAWGTGLVCSTTYSAWPPFCKCPAMGAPMMPKPIKPMLLTVNLLRVKSSLKSSLWNRLYFGYHATCWGSVE